MWLLYLKFFLLLLSFFSFDFNDFVQNWLNHENAKSWYHFRPQSDYLLNSKGEMPLDFIGKFENIEQDFQFVCRKIGVTKKLMHTNLVRKIQTVGLSASVIQ